MGILKLIMTFIGLAKLFLPKISTQKIDKWFFVILCNLFNLLIIVIIFIVFSLLKTHSKFTIVD